MCKHIKPQTKTRKKKVFLTPTAGYLTFFMLPQIHRGDPVQRIKKNIVRHTQCAILKSPCAP